MASAEVTPTAPDAELATLREGQDRMLHREGIPMALVLVSEVGPMPAMAEGPLQADGRRLAETMDRLRSRLAPSSRDDDMGCVTVLLHAAAYADFGKEPGR